MEHMLPDQQTDVNRILRADMKPIVAEYMAWAAQTLGISDREAGAVAVTNRLQGEGYIISKPRVMELITEILNEARNDLRGAVAAYMAEAVKTHGIKDPKAVCVFVTGRLREEDWNVDEEYVETQIMEVLEASGRGQARR